jgi:hypothetical protein
MSGQYSVFTKEEIADAKSRGITIDHLHNRHGDLGWSKKEALFIPIGANRTLTDEQLARMKAKGISRNTVYSRIITLGWSIEDAIETPPRARRNRVIDKYLTEKEIAGAVKKGITEAALYYRLTNGWSEEDAISIPTNSCRKYTKYKK